METDIAMNDSSATDDDWLPQEPMDRLFISAPQGPPRLPGPPTFGTFGNIRGCKHVHFQGAQVVSIIKAGSEMTPEERRELWYSTEDLDGYKTEVRAISRKLRGPTEDGNGIDAIGANDAVNESLSPHPCHTSTPSDMEGGEEEEDKKPAAAVCGSEVAEEGETRGLEHRVCLNRQRHKYLAIRCTLKAQMQSRCPDFIARISNKCTQWAKELAVAEADRDFCEAYCPQKLTTPRKLKHDCPIRNFFLRAPKRCHESEQASECMAQDYASHTSIEHRQPGVAVAPLGGSPPEEKKKSSCWMDRCVRQKCTKDC